jgi:uncharacterized membrane protein
MLTTKRQLYYLIGGVIVFVLVVNVGLGYFLMSRSGEARDEASSNTKTVQAVKTQDLYSYKGEDGVDALSLLKKKTSVEQDESGLVVVINNRKADEKKREFWAFYVNGKLSQVGPAEYVTKNKDAIEWKIENY